MVMSGIELIKGILEKCKENLKDNEIYLSEDDFKFSFAQAVFDVAEENGVENPEVILEYPILTHELYNNDRHKELFIESYPATIRDGESKYNKDRTFIDVYFKYNGDEYFVELKFKTVAIRGENEEKTVFRHELEFYLKNQGAYDLGLYAFYEDIERMEAIKRINSKRNAFCILVTNDSSYWRLPIKQNAIATHVTLNELSTKSGEIRFYIGTTNYRTLLIANQYPSWGENDEDYLFKRLNGYRNGLFRVLIVETK